VSSFEPGRIKEQSGYLNLGGIKQPRDLLKQGGFKNLGGINMKINEIKPLNLK